LWQQQSSSVSGLGPPEGCPPHPWACAVALGREGQAGVLKAVTWFLSYVCVALSHHLNPGEFPCVSHQKPPSDIPPHVLAASAQPPRPAQPCSARSSARAPRAPSPSPPCWDSSGAGVILLDAQRGELDSLSLSLSGHRQSSIFRVQGSIITPLSDMQPWQGGLSVSRSLTSSHLKSCLCYICPCSQGFQGFRCGHVWEVILPITEGNFKHDST
jgi:hypothetical protein